MVNVNPLYTARELKHQLHDAGVDTIVIVANFAATLQQVVGELSLRNIVVTEIGDLLPTLKGFIVNQVVKRVKKLVPEFHLAGAVSFKQALKHGAQGKFQPVSLSGDDLAFLQYTGGTTGVAKGAMLTHRNIMANVLQAHAVYGPVLHDGAEIVITALPLYHIFALTVNCFLFIYLGGHNVLVTNPRDIPDFIKILKSVPFTAMTGVNTLFNALLNNSDFKTLDFSRFHIAIGGGMAVQRKVAEQWRSLTGVPLLEGYGLTESSPLVTVNPYDLPAYNGSIGLPVSSTDIQIRDEQGKVLAQGEIGELWVQGPQVMLGYWQRPDETAKVISDGWLATGDMARIDNQGFIYLVDRKKDMVLVSGFNVYPNEVEDVIALHPQVLEVAVIGVPDEEAGEAVKAFVVLKDGQLDTKQLK